MNLNHGCLQSKKEVSKTLCANFTNHLTPEKEMCALCVIPPCFVFNFLASSLPVWCIYLLLYLLDNDANQCMSQSEEEKYKCHMQSNVAKVYHFLILL